MHPPAVKALRGLVAPSHLADLKVIDMERVKLGEPWLAFDLPAGGKRLLQKGDGHVAPVKSGVVTFRDGAMQGLTPGTIIRGPQRVEMAMAAE